jgi:hypothetical protein
MLRLSVGEPCRRGDVPKHHAMRDAEATAALVKVLVDRDLEVEAPRGCGRDGPLTHIPLLRSIVRIAGGGRRRSADESGPMLDQLQVDVRFGDGAAARWPAQAAGTADDLR